MPNPADYLTNFAILCYYKKLSWSTIKHIGIYAGSCNNGWLKNAHFMTHVGNERGPEITEIRYMAVKGDAPSVPVAIYRLKPVKNAPEPGKIQITNIAENGGLTSGWEFTVYSDSDCKKAVKTVTTNENGIGTISDLEPGMYYVKETGYPGDIDASYWKMDTSAKTVTVTAGETAKVSFENTCYGKVKIISTADKGGAVAGWEFTVYSDSECTVVVGVYMSGQDGTVTTGLLAPGTYYVKETSYPDGIDTTYWSELPAEAKSVTISAGSTTSVSFENTYCEPKPDDETDDAVPTEAYGDVKRTREREIIYHDRRLRPCLSGIIVL